MNINSGVGEIELRGLAGKIISICDEQRKEIRKVRVEKTRKMDDWTDLTAVYTIGTIYGEVEVRAPLVQKGSRMYFLNKEYYIKKNPNFKPRR